MSLKDKYTELKTAGAKTADGIAAMCGPLPQGWQAHDLSPPPVTVLALGSKVKIGGEIEGIVLGVWLQAGQIQYSVSWWNGRTRSVEWLHENEIEAKDAETTQIGFHR